MTLVVPEAGRWLVSTQSHGEVLTVRATAPGLSLLLLGLPAGFGLHEIESWLQGLARAVHEGSGAASPTDPVPPILRQALEGLLFSHAEIWGDEEGVTPCSVVLVHRDGRLGFGCVGDAEVDIRLDDVALPPEWTWIRDPMGREARAWCTTPEHEVWIELATTVEAATSAMVRLEVRWIHGSEEATAEAAFLPDDSHEEVLATPFRPDDGFQAEAALPFLPEDDVRVGDAPSFLSPEDDREEEEKPASTAQQMSSPAGPLTPEEERPSTGVARWLAQHVQWQAEPAEPAAEPGFDSEALEPAEPFELAESIPSEESLDFEEGIVSEAEPIPASSVATSREERSSATPVPAEYSLPSTLVARDEPRTRPPRRPNWPTLAPIDPPERRWKRPALWGSLALVLLGLGWVFGTFQSEGPAEAQRSSRVIAFLRSIGLAGPIFQVQVESGPPGAWIAVDGRELAARTPATLELKPGDHRVELSFPELGSASYTVTGKKNERMKLNAPLWGALDVVASQPGAVVGVSVDGETRGFAPIRIERLAPGPHELRFTGAGMASWGSTVEVRVGETREVLAYPLQSPATGVLQVRATHSLQGETQALSGARVWIDGEARGVTPLTLELPRGPHSIRVANRQEEAPIQVIDLPGGNQRFANFEFGLDAETPILQLRAPALISLAEPALISVTCTQLTAAEVREMWLHARTPESRWRRYPMTLLDGQGTVVGAVSFPSALLAAGQKTPYYVSALTTQGDEYFTEIQKAQPAPRRP
jgi:hypothetical protein